MIGDESIANTVEVKVPDLGGRSEVPVIEVLVKVGDAIKKDQGLVTLESDKATMEVPSSAAGVVRELRVKLGDKLSEGMVVAILEATEAGGATVGAASAPGRFKLDPYIERLNYYFEHCGSLQFAKSMSQGFVLNTKYAKNLILGFTKQDIIDAAYFHGNIGEAKKTLDSQAASEQQKVLAGGEAQRQELLQLGQEYLNKFGFKFLISAKDKTADEILSTLKTRLHRSFQDELGAAREALWEITRKRMIEHPLGNTRNKINDLLEKHKIVGASVSINAYDQTQTLSSGWAPACFPSS